ncbi:MAG: hypothetical protein AVDCRST_MAG75-2872 [uncultured Propionibacteriaceae bacterium]|jgi:uncharacterized repeat protein (TIGR03847 family)|uniref:Repeat protein (TIGR03847 family) n=1 Tax=uncultured Propionibacteriaceae bacterium TaxID=257457 RepID=A0A6J4PJT6_9ACTN|nr:MAG: hypothetical protein AVDCRST_MAG75-2872 [uncultured Propionibacteriaceae bacterium]
MAILVHRYDSPDRFVAGTVGQPGERTFFLQAREGNRMTSVVVEKQQVSVLAEHLERVLDEVLRRSSGEAPVPPPAAVTSDTEPLDAPITEEFRVGTMTIAWDPSVDKIVIELFSNVEAEESEDPESEASETGEVEADEVFVVKITPSYARDFVARATALISAGRPACPFCLQPMDASGHICPRANGYRRPLF